MQLTYLGTAAAEGLPAVFCNCPVCRQAARLGGRNIRTRSQSLVNRDLLIDLPTDTYLHKLQNGLDLSAVKYVFVTHWHMDHFYPQELTVRGSYYSHGMVSPELEIYCAAETRAQFEKVSWEANPETLSALHFHILRAFQPVRAGEYTVTPLPANHMHELESNGKPHPYFYLIEAEGRRLLYAHDTGLFLPEVWDFLKDRGPIQLVSLDGTSGLRECGPKAGHMGLPDNIRVREKLLEMGVCDGETKFILNHFSHNGGMVYDEYAPLAAEKGFAVSYDGMAVEV